jgi:hypothetical protein
MDLEKIRTLLDLYVTKLTEWGYTTPQCVNPYQKGASYPESMSHARYMIDCMYAMLDDPSSFDECKFNRWMNAFSNAFSG